MHTKKDKYLSANLDSVRKFLNHHVSTLAEDCGVQVVHTGTDLQPTREIGYDSHHVGIRSSTRKGCARAAKLNVQSHYRTITTEEMHITQAVSFIDIRL